jgi:hypothetical protein
MPAASIRSNTAEVAHLEARVHRARLPDPVLGRLRPGLVDLQEVDADVAEAEDGPRDRRLITDAGGLPKALARPRAATALPLAGERAVEGHRALQVAHRHAEVVQGGKTDVLVGRRLLAHLRRTSSRFELGWRRHPKATSATHHACFSVRWRLSPLASPVLYEVADAY